MEKTEKATQYGTTTLEISTPKVLNRLTCPFKWWNLDCCVFISGLYHSVKRDEFMKYKFHQGEQLVKLCEESSARVSALG